MFTFASSEIEAQWDSLHPVLRAIVDDFGHWSSTERLPIPVITCLGRSVEENRKIYGKDKFSWHIPDLKTGVIRAMDLRTKHYTSEQVAKVFGWFHERCPDVHQFELITKVHGTGPHIHLAIREH